MDNWFPIGKRVDLNLLLVQGKSGGQLTDLSEPALAMSPCSIFLTGTHGAGLRIHFFVHP